MTVTLSGRDIIVPTGAVWNYLTESSGGGSPSAGKRERFFASKDRTVEHESDLLKVFWFEGFNHADLFKSREATRGAARIVKDYCKSRGGTALDGANGYATR